MNTTKVLNQGDVKFALSVTDVTKAVTLHFTPEQFRRLTGGARALGISVEALGVTGCLNVLDMASSSEEAAVESTLGLVDLYANERCEFAYPDEGTGTKYALQVSE